MTRPPSRTPGDDSSRRSRRVGLLSFGRGMAVMMLALGINGVLAGSLSRYDPLYLYVVTVGVVAWFEGWLTALVTGVVALAAYELWFSTTRTTGTRLALPALSALAVVGLVTLARRMTRPQVDERPGVAPAAPAWVTDTREQSAASPLARAFDRGEEAPESKSTSHPGAAGIRDAVRDAVLDAVRLREELSRATADRDALQSSMQAALLRHQEESSKLKVERVRAMDEAREATQALSSATASLQRFEAELDLARRTAGEAQALAEAGSAAMLEGEARHGAEETRLRDALELEKEQAREAAGKIDSLAHDLALAAVERDRWQRATAEISEEAQGRIEALSGQHTGASAAASAANEELERERHRTAAARSTIAELERAAERYGLQLAAARTAAGDSATERARLVTELEAAGLEIDRWRQEYSRSSDDVARATAALTELSLVKSELEQFRLKHEQVTRSLEETHAAVDRVGAERTEVARQLAVASVTLAALGTVKSDADDLRAENTGLGRLLEIARGEAEHAESIRTRLTEELQSLAPLQSEVERLDGAHASAVRLLEEARADAESAREEARRTGEQLARATAELSELSTVKSEAEQFHIEHGDISRQLDQARADADAAREKARRTGEQLARATAELSELSTVKSEAEQLHIEHLNVSGLLDAARADAEAAREKNRQTGEQLARAVAELSELSTVKAEAEQLHIEHLNVSGLLDAARADAEAAREKNRRTGEQLARAVAELSELSTVKTEAEQLHIEHGDISRQLNQARAAAESAREEAGLTGEQLAQTAAALSELSGAKAEAERLDGENADLSHQLNEARAAAESAREEAARTGEQLERASASSIAELSAVKSEGEQLRLKNEVLARAAESAMNERDAAQTRAAMAATELAGAAETLAALTESHAVAEQLRTENRRLATALGAAGREAARLQADATHYADEVIGLRARLERGSAASPEAEALRVEVARLNHELEDARSRSDSLEKERLLSEERDRDDGARLLADFERERKGLREALDNAASANAEMTGRKEDSERWQAEAQRLAVQIEAALQTAAEESARAIEEQRLIREQSERDWKEKLEASDSLAAERQHEIGERDRRLTERETLLESAAGQIAGLREQLAVAHAEQSALDEGARLRETMTAAVAATASSAAARVETLETELARTVTDLAVAEGKSSELRAALEEQGHAFAEAEKGWDDKLQRIVGGLTTDHENDLGEAMLDREAAKAELRLATNQIARLEGSLRAAEVARDGVEQEWKRRGEQVLDAIVQRETTIRAAAEREVARLRVELEVRIEAYQKLEEAASEEKRRYEEAETSWGDKLQKIVANVTDDYEADLGEAITSREGARAEVRSLSTDLRAFQQKLAAAEELRRAMIAEAERREAEIERLAAAAAPAPASAESQSDGGALEKKLRQAEQINLAWGDAFAEREAELRREAAGQMADLQSQLDRLRKSEAVLTEAFRSAAADAQAFKRRLEEEVVAAEQRASQRDEAFRQGLLHAQQEWEDRFDAVGSEAERERQQLRMKLGEQEGELAGLRARDLEQNARREQAETEELRVTRQLELARQSDDERRARLEVLQFAEDARSLLMGGSPETTSSPAPSDPFPEAAADPAAPAAVETTSASDDFLAIVTRLGGNS
jgi:chromosome segregation ATPase